MPPRHGLSLQQMPSPWRHSIWNANTEFWESRGGNSFATRKYLRSLVYLPSTTSSDIVASPSLATSPDCRTAPYSLTSHVNLSLGRLPHPSWSRRPDRPRGRWIDQIRNDTSQTPAAIWRQALGRGHNGRATRRPTPAMRWWWWCSSTHGAPCPAICKNWGVRLPVPCVVEAVYRPHAAVWVSK